jgi:hypothetical protein
MTNITAYSQTTSEHESRVSATGHQPAANAQKTRMSDMNMCCFGAPENMSMCCLSCSAHGRARGRRACLERPLDKVRRHIVVGQRRQLVEREVRDAARLEHHVAHERIQQQRPDGRGLLGMHRFLGVLRRQGEVEGRRSAWPRTRGSRGTYCRGMVRGIATPETMSSAILAQITPPSRMSAGVRVNVMSGHMSR